MSFTENSKCLAILLIENIIKKDENDEVIQVTLWEKSEWITHYGKNTSNNY